MPAARLRLAAASALAALAWSSPAMGLDLDLYATLLERHTRSVDDAAGTRVGYGALRADPAWRRLVEGLDGDGPASLAGAEELAYWINVYNVLAIDWIVREGPVESIRDLGSLFRPIWKKPAGRVGGREVTLDEVEHEILRPLGEPRIHFAIVCASTSCPSLRREPFRAAALDRQLDEQARAFLADPRKGMAIDRAEREVAVSKIFRWFSRDFAEGGGVRAFLAKHAPEAERGWLLENRDRLDLDSLPYDWSLNGLPEPAASP